MIYNSLDIMPIKLFLKIVETKDLTLLGNLPNNELDELWQSLYAQYLELDSNPTAKRHFRTAVNVDFYLLKYQYILYMCEALAFDWDDEFVNQLKSYGYKITKENYYKDIERIVREANGLKIKAETLQQQLPKDEENNSKVNIDEVISGYCLILGYDLGDYNLLTVTKFLAIKKTVNAKVDNIKKQEQKNKSKRKIR